MSRAKLRDRLSRAIGRERFWYNVGGVLAAPAFITMAVVVLLFAVGVLLACGILLMLFGVGLIALIPAIPALWAAKRAREEQIRIRSAMQEPLVDEEPTLHNHPAITQVATFRHPVPDDSE